MTQDNPPHKHAQNIVPFTTDRELTYEPFNNDFGPLDLGALTRYSRALKLKLDAFYGKGIKLVHFASSDPSRRANSACLALSFLVVVEGLSPEDAWLKLATVRPPFKEFVDASMLTHSFTMTILDVLRGLETAVGLGWYNYATFDLEKFEHWKKVETGDLSWIIPNKFIAFAGPFDNGIDDDGMTTCSPESYHGHFKESGVTSIVRLNKRQYDSTKFTRAGFRHNDLIFNDGSCPPDNIRDAFLKIAVEEPTIAVHCKAGLGRTGTLIGVYAMIHHGFPARAFLGWSRTCRPGSILGPQQEYLCELERAILAVPAPSRALEFHATDEMMREDVGQGERLNRAKAHRKYSSASTTASGVDSFFFDYANRA